MSDTTVAQEKFDQAVVQKTIGEIEAHLRTAGTNPAWDVAYADAEAYIGGLFEEFAPGTDERLQHIGKTAGTIGLAWVTLQYGEDDQSPQLYSGTFEEDVLATYHHAGHSRDMIRNLFRYATMVNRRTPGVYDEWAFCRFPLIGSTHDGIIGNRRGTDERQSALLADGIWRLSGHAIAAPDARSTAAIETTIMAPDGTSQQLDVMKPHLPYRRAGGVADTLHVFEPDGVYKAICSGVEGMFKQIHGRIFSVEAAKLGIQTDELSVDDCLEVINKSEVLRATYGEVLAYNTRWRRMFRPADPDLDSMFPGRDLGVTFMESLVASYNGKHMRAADTLYAARVFMEASVNYN